MFALLIAALLSLGVSPAAAQSQQPAKAAPLPKLAGIKSWGYQLQKIDPADIAQSPFDLVVIDYSRNGGDSGRFSKDDVKAMQTKPDGGRRLVLAYLSIGEAEDYRYYWNKAWVEPAPFRKPTAGKDQALVTLPETVRIPRLVAPGWLSRENEQWHGNYLIRYWYEGWQNILIYGEKSYLARIQDAGFDGVYLDRVDAFYAIESDRDDAARRMIDLVADLAKEARKRQPDFLLVAQNAEELLRAPKYLALINAIAKEDLLFGNSNEGAPNAPDRIKKTTDHLLLAKAAGLPVMVVEYLENPDAMLSASEQLAAQGFIPYFAPRKLDRLAKPTAWTR